MFGVGSKYIRGDVGQVFAPDLSLIACHECDCLYRINHIPESSMVKCRRCGAVLIKNKRHTIDTTLALTVTGLILFIISNAYPILSFDYEGQVTQTILMTGVMDLFDQNMPLLAGLVFFTAILIPVLQLLLLLYVFLPLKFNRIPWMLAVVFRFVNTFSPWSMLEVFMLGVLVSIAKLAATATIIPGVALWSFSALIVVLAAAESNLNPDLVWARVAANTRK